MHIAHGKTMCCIFSNTCINQDIRIRTKKQHLNHFIDTFKIQEKRCVCTVHVKFRINLMEMVYATNTCIFASFGHVVEFNVLTKP